MPLLPPRPYTMKSLYRILIACLGLCLVAQLVPSGVSAQTDEIDQLRADRDALRADRSRAAADLDPLFASNEKIEESLRVLNEDLAAREAELEATQSQLEQARLDVIASQDEVVQQQVQIADLRAQLQEQAITAYVQPDETGDDVLRSSDLNEGERRRALVSATLTSQADILDDLREAQARLELAAARAESATLEIESRRLEVEQQRAEVNAAIVDQQRLQAILDARIAEFQQEVDFLDAEEAQLQAEITGLVIEEENRQAAIREAARIQAERERVAREEEQRRQAELAAIAAGQTPNAGAATVSRADAALVGAPTAGIGSLLMPVNGTVTSRFGPRWGRQHNGIDVAANTGTTVAAAAGGTVIAAGSSGGFGQRVLISHSGGLVTLYAHLSSINVSNGQSVSAGSAIGAVGCTGSCTGPHLHFETRVAGVAYDPFNYLG